jgi:RNA polymerase sigma factor (sigma-70 family)
MPAMPMSEVLLHLRSVLLPDGRDLTDGELLECFASRQEPAALEVLVRRHAPMVWGVCRRVLGNHHDAEDAFQATFLVLVRKGVSVYPRAKIGSWLYGVAHQTALKARANRSRRKERERPVTEMPEPAVQGPEHWHDMQAVVDQEVSRLPEKYRAVIILCNLEGKSVSEAARQLGCPPGTVASRLARARTILARRLARHGSAVSGAMLAAVLPAKGASAAVPPSVLSLTLKTAVPAAGGQAAASGAVSGTVAALTEGVIRAMLLNKLKVNAFVTFVVIALALGAAGLMHRSQAAGQDRGATAWQKESGPSGEGAPPQGGPSASPQAQSRKQTPSRTTVFQVRILGPVGAKIRLLRPRDSVVQKLPCRLTFERPGKYRLELSDIPNRPGLVLYPTVEVFPATAKTAEYLAHAAIPVAFTAEDLELAAADRLATRMVALTDKTVESPVSVRGDNDAIEAAKKKGTLLLVMRLGSIDLDSKGTFGAPEKGWTLDFHYQSPRFIRVDVPGAGRRTVLYLWCKVANKTGKTVTFAPGFEVATHAGGKADRVQKAPAAVLEAIGRVEDPTGHQGLVDLAAIQRQPLAPASGGPARPRQGTIVGVATWDSEKSDSGTLTVFVSGLSNEQRRDEKNRLSLKTLKLTFRREKDKYGVWQEWSPVSREWVYRPATLTREKEARVRTSAPGATPKSDDAKPLGRILRMTARGDKVYINLGKADDIHPKMTFSVYEADSLRTDRSPKASLEVLTVIGPHLSLAQVTSLHDPDRTPLVQGDRLYQPASKRAATQKVGGIR